MASNEAFKKQAEGASAAAKKYMEDNELLQEVTHAYNYTPSITRQLLHGNNYTPSITRQLHILLFRLSGGNVMSKLPVMSEELLLTDQE